MQAERLHGRPRIEEQSRLRSQEQSCRLPRETPISARARAAKKRKRSRDESLPRAALGGEEKPGAARPRAALWPCSPGERCSSSLGQPPAPPSLCGCGGGSLGRSAVPQHPAASVRHAPADASLHRRGGAAVTVTVTVTSGSGGGAAAGTSFDLRRLTSLSLERGLMRPRARDLPLAPESNKPTEPASELRKKAPKAPPEAWEQPIRVSGNSAEHREN
mmetsp:Transcript_117058/g.313838  ORF Transcript_117058/g.313838 Transcript_117058/m.313838 type:complete len:218 (+) Transcript_117058:669-1322(+)